MSAVTRNLKIYRGEDVPLNYTLSPVEDITGWTVKFTVKKSYASLENTFQVDAGIDLGTDGYMTFVLPSASTDIAPGHYVYDIVRLDEDSRSELFIGQLEIKPGVYTTPIP